MITFVFMKERILELRAKGLTYNQISEQLNCSKSTVSYHCNPKVKEKSLERNKNNPNKRNNNRTFKFTDKVRAASNDFKRLSGQEIPFNYKDVLNKFGENTFCYLTGQPINLLTDDFHFDHIIPVHKGGSGNLDNLGITTKEANMAKSSLMLDEFFNLCKSILTFNGYIVTNPEEDP